MHKEKLSKCDPAIEMDDMYVKTSLSGNVLDKHAPANPCGLAARALFNDTYTLFNNKSD